MISLKTFIRVFVSYALCIGIANAHIVLADQLAADAVKGGDSAKEVQLFCNLCEVTPEDIKRLTLKDYKKLQEAFLFFTSD